MVNELQPSPSDWEHTLKGALRHVSGLTFMPTVVRGRKKASSVVTLALDAAR